MKVYAASKLLDRREFGVGKRLRPTMSSYERLDQFLIKFGWAGSILLRWVGRMDEGIPGNTYYRIYCDRIPA